MLLVTGERCDGGVVGVLKVEIFVLGIEKITKLKQVVEQGYLTTVECFSQHGEIVVVGNNIEILRELRLQSYGLCIIGFELSLYIVPVGVAVKLIGDSFSLCSSNL